MKKSVLSVLGVTIAAILSILFLELQGRRNRLPLPLATHSSFPLVTDPASGDPGFVGNSVVNRLDSNEVTRVQGRRILETNNVRIHAVRSTVQSLILGRGEEALQVTDPLIQTETMQDIKVYPEFIFWRQSSRDGGFEVQTELGFSFKKRDFMYIRPCLKEHIEALEREQGIR